MRQVLMQRGNHIFIRYCAGESVFAGFRRIAKLATSIAIAVAFTGIALPTSSAQAQIATLAATGNPSISDGEEKTFTLTLDELPTDRNITHATVTLIVRGDNPLLEHPSGTGYEGASFDVIVTGDNNRAVTLNRQSGAGRIQKRMSVTIPLDPTSSTAGAGQPAVITYTVRGKSVLSDQSFSLATFAKSFSFRDNNSNDFELSGLAVTGSPQSFTVAASDDRVLLTYGYPNGATIPNFKAEEPDSYTGLAGNLWSGGRNLLLASGVAAHYTDGTVYQCAESSTGNCVINLGAFSGDIGRIVAGGPVHVTALGIPPTAVSAIAADDAAEGEDIDVTITLNQRLPLTASGVGRVAYAVAGRGASPIDPAADVIVASPATFSADGTGPTLTFTIAANVDNLVEGDETGTVTVTGITWSGGNNLTGLSESADFAVSDVALPPPVVEPQDPLLIYTYENLAVIPDHLFKSEEPTNASSDGITWADGESLTLTKDTTARYDDGTNYKCLSSGGCVITFASRQINSGGQVRISQPFEIGSQQFIPGATARILFNPDPPDTTNTPPVGIPGPEVRAGNQDAQAITRPRARTIPENHGTGAERANHEDGVPAFQVAPLGLPSGVTASCVYGLGGGALYLGDDDENPTIGDYFLVNGGTEVPLGDLSQPGERDADVNHLFTTPCNLDALTPWNIRIIDDTIDEQDEVIRIILKSMTLFVTVGSNQVELGSVRVDQPDTLALTITDNDDPTIPRVTVVTATDAEATEAGGTATITVTLSQAVENLEIDYGILTGPHPRDPSLDFGDLSLTADDFAPLNGTPPGIAIDTGTVVANSASKPSEIPRCAGTTDLRCGTLIITDETAPYVTTITITARDDGIPELSEDFTFFLRGRLAGDPPDDPENDPDLREANVLFPNFGALADRSARISITDDDSTTVALVDADTDGDFIYGAAVVLERSAANTSTSLNNTFTLNAATNATLGYLLTGPGAGDIAVTAGSGDAANTTAVTPNDDPRGGTFTVTGTTGTTGSLQLTAAADAVLEGTESFTLTLYAGNPDDTRLLLANGAKNYTITDATDVTARLTWPGTATTRTGGEQRPSREDASSPIGVSVFPGGVLEGASPHVLLDLHVTGDDTTPVTVGRDLFFPISCGGTPNCGPQGPDIRIESINDDKGTRARSDDTIVHGFFIRAGRSQEATGINTVPDSIQENDETFTFNTGDPIEFRGQDTPTGIDARVTPFATDASLTVHDRPVDAGDITWVEADPAQADFGAGLTKIADLVITLPGGFTADHSAVTVDYTYNGSDALGSISFRDPDNTSTIYATREVILRNEDDDVIGTRERITVVRTSFSKADPGSDPTATVGLYFSPAASGSGERPTVDVKKVSHVDLLTVSFDRDLCNDGLPGAAPGSAPCANQQFGVGVPMVDFPSAGQDLSASEAGDTGGFSIQIVNNDSPTEAEPNFFPASPAVATIGFSLGGTARRGLGLNSRDYVLSVSRSTNADGTGSPVSITPNFEPSGLTGTVTLAHVNRAQYINFLVTPNADDVNDIDETVVIRITGVTFSDAATTTDITVNRGLTVTIANAPVPAIVLGSGPGFITHNRLQGRDSQRTGALPPFIVRSSTEGLGGRTPQVRLWLTGIPANAYYATLSQEVVTGALPGFNDATYGGGTNGNGPVGGNDYRIAGRLWPSDPAPGGTVSAWIPATRSITVNRGGDQIGNTEVFGSVTEDGFQADQWLVLRADGDEEGPEVVVIDYSLEVFGCTGYNGPGDTCGGSQGDKIGDTITRRVVFRISDGSGVVQDVEASTAEVFEDVDESDRRVAVTAAISGFTVGEEIAYTITGDGITAEDFASNSLTGTLRVDTSDKASGVITIADDDLGEDAETFTITINPGDQHSQTVLPGAKALVTIADSDGGGPPPVPTATLATTGTSRIAENGGSTTLTLQLTDIPTGEEIDNAQVTLSFTNSPDTGSPGFSGADAGDNMVAGTNYDVLVASPAANFSASRNSTNNTILASFDYDPANPPAPPVLTYTITAKDITPPHLFNVNIDSVVFRNVSAVVTLDPVLREVGEPQSLTITDAVGAKTVTVSADDPTFTFERSAAPGLITFTLSEDAPAGGVTVDFTTANTDGAVRGSCRTISAAALCDDVDVSTLTYALAERTGPTAYTSLATAATSFTIAEGTREYVMAVIAADDNVAGDAPETVAITFTGANNDFEIRGSRVVNVSTIDPGTATLRRKLGGRDILGVGATNSYEVVLANVGVADGAVDGDSVRNGPGGVEIDAVIELTFMDNTFGELPDNYFDTGSSTLIPIPGSSYNVTLDNAGLDALVASGEYEITLTSNVLRVVVDQARLQKIGGQAAGAEDFSFSIIPVGEIDPATSIGMVAYTVTTDMSDRQYAITPSVTGNSFSSEGLPTAGLTLSSSLTGDIPTTATEALTLSFTNTFPTEIAGAEISYTLRITPTGTDGITNDISDDPPFSSHFEVIPAGGVALLASAFSTPADDNTARQFTVTESTAATLADGDSRTLTVSLRALTFAAPDRSFDITLDRVTVVDTSGVSEFTLVNSAPAATQSVEVTVAASTGPTATLNLTGSSEIEFPPVAGSGLDKTTFEIVLDNIPTKVMDPTPDDGNDDAADTNIVSIDLNFAGSDITNTTTDIDNTFATRVGATNIGETNFFSVAGRNGIVAEGTGNLMLNFKLDNDDVTFVDVGGDERQSFMLSFTITNKDGSHATQNNIVVAISAVTYLDTAGLTTTGKEADISPPNRIALKSVARAAARVVAVTPAGQQNIAQRVGTGRIGTAEFAVSLTNVFANIVTTSPASTTAVDRVLLTLGRDANQNNAFATTTTPVAGVAHKGLTMGGGNILLTLPAEPAGLMFIAASATAPPQVSIPTGTNEFTITVSLPNPGVAVEDTLDITQVAYLAAGGTVIPAGPRPHIPDDIQFKSVANPVELNLSTGSTSTIDAGGETLGMRKFSLELTNLENSNTATIPLTLGGIGAITSIATGLVTGTNYNVELLEITGTNNPTATLSAPSDAGDVVVTVAAPATNAGDATVVFRITSGSTALAIPISIDPTTVDVPSREVVVNTRSLAFSIVATGATPSVRFDPAELTVLEDGGNFADTTLTLSAGIPDTNVNHIDITLEADGLTFNRAATDGQSITLGSAAAILTSRTANHSFPADLNNTVGSRTAILRVTASGGSLRESMIRLTGGFVNSDMNFTLTPTNLAYYSTPDSIPAGVLAGPNGATQVHFLPGMFSVNAVEAADASGTVGSPQTNIVVGDVGGGTVTITLADVGLSGFIASSSVSAPVGAAIINVKFGATGNTDFAFERTAGSNRLDITGISNADGFTYPFTYNSGNTVSIEVPRARLFASTGATAEEQGEEVITINFTALTEDTYPVEVSGGLVDASNISLKVDPDSAVTTPFAIPFAAPNPISFTARTATATLAIDTDSSPNEEGTVSGGYDLTLTNFPARETTIDYVISAPGANGAIPVEDYNLVVVADGVNVDRVSTPPELNPDDDTYTGSFTLLAADFATNPAIISISVVPVDDGIVEGPETVTLTIPDIPGVDYTPPVSALEITITDNDNAVAVLTLNGEVVASTLNTEFREGFTYPVQLFLVQGTTAALTATTVSDAVSNGTLAVLKNDFTFMLMLEGVGIATDDNDYVLGDDSIFIPAGASSGLTTLELLDNDDDPDREERFRVSISGSLPPGVIVGANTAQIIIPATAAPTGFCAGRTPEVAAAIIAALTTIDNCGAATAAQMADATTFAMTLDDDVTSLTLSGASLTSLQLGDFAGLTGLTSLDLSNNDLRALPVDVALSEDVFDDLDSIQTINLSGNKLTAAGIPATAFNGLTTLRTLNLGGNATLTSLPTGVLDDVLGDLTSLDTGTGGTLVPVKRFLTFADNEYTVTQGGTVMVSLNITDAAGDPATTPVAASVPFVGLTTGLTSTGSNVIVPAGSGSVMVELSATDVALTGAAMVGFGTVLLGTEDGGLFSDESAAPAVISNLFAAEATATVNVVAPVVMDPLTATAAELNNVQGVIDLTLNRLTDDTGTADVTFTLNSGEPVLGTDYDLDITRPDGTPDGTPVKVGNTGDGLVGADLVLAAAATGGTFRLAAGDNGATFTITPIADGFPSSETETVTITVTAVNYSGPGSHTNLTAAADIAITDNTTPPTAAVTTGDNEITENSGTDGRGEFTITLTSAPKGVATVLYTLVVDNADAISPGSIRFGGDLGGEPPTAPYDTTVGEFTMTVRDSESPAEGTLAFSAGSDTDQANNDVVLTVTGVTFADIGDGTDISAPDPASATITIIDDDPDSTLCTRSERVHMAIVAALTNVANCGEVMNSDPDNLLRDLNPNGGLTVSGLTVSGDSSLRSGDFDGLTSLTRLTLNGDLTSLPAGVFDEPIALTSLTLDGALTGAVPKVFDTLVDLVTLDLSDNAFDDITDAAFDTLTGLTTLNLSGNSIAAVSDAAIFTPLTALTTLNLGGNTTLSLENGALDVVLDGLDILTWPIAPSIASFPTNTSITVEQGQTEPVPVQLDSALPVAVSIPITVTFPGDRVSTTTEAIFPAGDTAVNAIITADSNASTTATSGTLAIGTPRLLIGGDLPGAPGTDIANVDDSRVRSALIVRDSATASVNVIAVTGPTARLSGSNTSLGLGGTANFSLVLSNIDDITDTAFTHVSVIVELGGRGIAGDLALVPNADSAQTSDYRIDITSGNVSTSSPTAVDAQDAQAVGGDPAALIFYVPADQFDAGDDGSTDVAGAETINFTLTIKDDAGFSLTTTPNTLIPSLSLASSNPNILAVDVFQNPLSNVDITVLNPTLTYTITAPFTVSPASAEIDEGERAEIILTLTNAASGPVTIPYSVVGSTGTILTTDYTIDPTGDSTATDFVIPNGESRASIFVTAVSDRVVDDDDKTVTIFLTTGAYPGGGAGMFTGSGALVATVTIDNADTAPTGVTVTANPTRINETGNTTQSIITVRLNEPALALTGVDVVYAITGGAELEATGTCSATGNDYTAVMDDGTVLTSTGGMLSFAAGTAGMVGRIERRITVTACEDVVDESDADEDVIFTLSSANRGVNPGTPREATITIREITVVPEDVMKQVETVATVVATEHVTALTTLIRQRFSATSSFGSLPRVPSGAVPSTTTNLSLSDNPENMNDMINSMGLEKTAQGDSNNQYAVWIRGQRSVFEGTPEIRGLTIDYDGTTTGIGMGAEYSSGGYLAGLAMNYVTTEVDLSSESEGETISKYEESMVIAAPYFSLKAGEGTSLWASVGVGTGTADAKLATQTKSADVSLTFLNAGADFTVIGRSFEIVTGLSGLVIRKVVDSFTFTEPEHILPKTTIDTMQAVGEVTIYRPIPIAGQIVRPYMGISTIHDFGDIVADDDHGLGIRTGVAFGLGRVSADIELSSELLRENRRQWTVSGGARFASRPGGQGLSLSLDGTQETQMDTGESVDDDAARTWGIGLEGGYGMPAGLFHPDGVLTPFASIDQAGDGRDMSGGVRFSVGNGLSLDLETTRQMHDDSEDASEHKAGLRGRWSF